MDHSSSGQVADFNDQQKQAVITSLCCTLMSKIKLIFQNPLKNKQLASNQNLLSIIELIGENLLPHYCVKNYKNSQKLSYMHSLIYLLTSKIQAVFTSGVIKTCIDQNWDLKGFKAVLLRVLNELGLPNTPEDVKKLQELFDKLIQSQNLQSQSCIKAISYYLKNRNKSNIDEDDLKNPIVSFQTTFDFVKFEIQKFRSQNMSHTCFTVLHPWAYDLDLVDFKYVINKDQTVKVTEALDSSIQAQVFWLSYFKSQLSCSADEFIVALRELAEMNNASDAFEGEYDSLRLFLHQTNFVINIKDHKEQIINYINAINNSSHSHNILHDQVNLRQDTRPNSDYIDESKLSGSKTEFSLLKDYIPQSRLVSLNTQQSQNKITFKRLAPELQPSVKQPNNLFLKFTNVDTEELKDLEIKFDGNLAQFKVGEGDCNHYIICNDKKLWESQFMILNKDGKYYIRDLGIVHTSRIKVNSHTSLQIHQGALLDLGKVVHYHVDKLLHEKVPSQQSNPNFIVMKGSQANYREDDEALLRARPTWISGDENKDLVQNEIILENSEKSVFSVGRSNKRDVEIKLKAVSADHCKIEYNREKGWFVHEKDKDRLSSNGTFVFMKSLQQMEDHEPSDFIPLFDGMTVSFINYELQVRIENKTSEELAKSECVPIDQIKPQATPVQSTRVQLDVQTTPKKETPQQKPKQQHDDVYQEELQATHAQKSQPQFVEEQKSARSLQQDEEDAQEELKSSHSKQDLDQSQNSHRSSKQSLHNQSHHHDHDQQHDDADVHNKLHKSLKSVGGGVDADQQSHHNQSVHSQRSHHSDKNDQQDDDQADQQPSVHHDASQKSLKQSDKDQIQDDVSQQQHQDQSDFQVHHTEEDIKDDYQEERKSQLSQRSAHNKSLAAVSVHDQIDDQVQSHHTQHDEEEVKSHQQSVHDQLDDSPKAVSKTSHKDDEERQEMQRSYSQHHIAEILDQAHGGSQHSQSKHQLIHSDDEEEDQKQPSAQHHQDDDDQQAVAHNKSVHDDEIKSQRSQKSLKQEQTHQDVDSQEIQVQSIHNQDDQASVHNQSQHSLHQSSKHDLSQHQDDPYEESKHNYSVHSVAASQKHQDLEEQQEEAKSQANINQSIHHDEEHIHNQSSQSLHSHKSASPSKVSVQDNHHEEMKHQASPQKIQHHEEEKPHQQQPSNDNHVQQQHYESPVQHQTPSVDNSSHNANDQQHHQQQDDVQQQQVDDVQQQQDAPNDDQ